MCVGSYWGENLCFGEGQRISVELGLLMGRDRGGFRVLTGGGSERPGSLLTMLRSIGIGGISFNLGPGSVFTLTRPDGRAGVCSLLSFVGLESE